MGRSCLVFPLSEGVSVAVGVRTVGFCSEGDLQVVDPVVSSTQLTMSDDTTRVEGGEGVADLAAKVRIDCWSSRGALPLFRFLLRAETSIKGVRSSLGCAVRDGASDGIEMVLGG